MIVIRSELVSPGLTRSCWTLPVAATRVVTLPAATDAGGVNAGGIRPSASASQETLSTLTSDS